MRALATITRNIEQAEHLIGQRVTIAMYHAPHVYTGPCLAVRSLYDTVSRYCRTWIFDHSVACSVMQAPCA
jgi:hypothetical protein